MSYLDEVRGACVDHCPGILMEWLPGGHIVGRSYQCADIHGGPGDSLKVTMSGRGAGLWKDWASGEPGGDLIALYGQVKGLEYKESLRELADKFGIERPAKKPRGQWESIAPVPESAYKCDDYGNPQLPDIKFRQNAVPSAFWPYFDAEGRLLCFRCRFEPPSIGKGVPLSWCRDKKTGETTWRWKDLPRPRPLYNLVGLSMNPEQILIVSGEKCVESARYRLPGWCVITWPGGDKNVQHSDWKPLIDYKGRIVIWPDNDDSCRRAMAEVSEILSRPCEVVNPDPGWPEGYDVADLDWTPEKLSAWIEKAVAKVEPRPKHERPLIELRGNDRFYQMQAIYQGIKDCGADLYYTANGLCELKQDIYGKVSLNYLDAGGLRDWCSRNIDTRKHVSNELRWTEVAINLASALTFSAQEFVRPLWYVSHTPIISPSGKMIDKPGYDPETKIYVSLPKDYTPCGSVGEASDQIRDLLVDFPHETQADLTHAVSLPMTCILRHAISSPTPLYRFEAPSPGTGKTLEGRTLFEIVTPNAEYLPAVKDNEEATKVITAALLRMPAVIAFDNVSEFETASVMQALTNMWWSSRVLGQSKVISLPIWNVWAATLNNPEMSREMLRRSVRVRLNSHLEHPEKRPSSAFRHPDVVGYARKFRSQLLAAFACLCQTSENGTNGQTPYLGGYGAWCEALYPRLEAAGFKGFLSTYDTDLETACTSKEQGVAEFFSKWAEDYGDMEVTADALLSIAMSIGAPSLGIKSRKDGAISTISLGWMIRKNRDKIFGSFLVHPPNNRGGRVYYRLSDISSDSNSSKNTVVENEGFSF